MVYKVKHLAMYLTLSLCYTRTRNTSKVGLPQAQPALKKPCVRNIPRSVEVEDETKGLSDTGASSFSGIQLVLLH